MMEDYELERTHHSLTKNNLSSFLMEGIDTRNLNDGNFSAMVELGVESDIEESGGMREAPTCHELAIEGESLTKQGEHEEAIPVLEAALETGTEDPQLLSVLWSLLGNAHFYQGDYETAAVCHAHDLAICCETGDEKSKAQAYCNLGIANRKSGYLERAKLCYESYLEICELLEDRRSISKANHNLGDLHLTLGRLKLQRDGKLENSPEGRDHLSIAAMYFEKHLEYILDHGSKAAEARVHGNLGIIYELLRNTDKAIDHHQKRLHIAQELADKASEGRAYCSIGNCLRAILQPDKAMECYKRGLSIASDLDDQIGLGVCHCNLATTYEILGNWLEASDQHEKHLQAMKNSNNMYGQAAALSNMAKVYEYLANVSKAIEALERLAVLQKELCEDDKIKETLEEITRLGGSLKENESTSPSNKGTLPTAKGEVTNTGSGGKKGGILKKLKEKRAKKQSIVGPETPLSVSGLIESRDLAWGGDKSPSNKQEKKSKKSVSKEKLNTIKQDSPMPQRSGSVSSRDDLKEKDVAESPPGAVNGNSSPSNERGRKRSWSHGNTNRGLEGSTEQGELTAFLSNSQLSHSGSATFTCSSGGGTQNSDGTTDQYVINGPSPGDPLGTLERRKDKKPLYKNFGSESHRQTLMELEEFLDTSNETEPVDLTKLLDWDGWMIGSRDVVVQSTKESKLI